MKNIAIILFVCVFQIVFTRASDASNYDSVRTNNNDLQRCLSSVLASNIRTVYPCHTSANQEGSQYNCDNFNVSTLSSVRGGRIPHSPAVIVDVMNDIDVQNVVKCAAKLNYVVNTLGGGHSYEGYGLGSKHNNIIINMAGINYMSINQSDGTGRFGSGARLGPIYHTTYQYDKLTINGGSCAWVGLAGLALGGGKGFLGRLHGLLSDNILEMKAVNAQGDLLTINDNHEPDLYWGLRGSGGGLFVIVTEFKLRLVKSPLLVTVLISVWSANTTKLIIEQFQSLTFNEEVLNLPNNISMLMTVKSASTEILISYYGVELEEFNRTVTLFLSNLPPPIEMSIKQQEWLAFVYEHSSIVDPSGDLQELLLNNLTYPTYHFKAKHLFYDEPITSASLDQLIARLASINSSISLQFSLWGGYMRTIPVDQTAFPHRNYRFGIQFMVYWDDHQDESEQLNQLNQIYLTIYNDSTKYSYINYIDRDLPNWMSAYYNTHQERLMNIKHMYDKENRFDFERTIHLSGTNHQTFFSLYLTSFLIFSFAII